MDQQCELDEQGLLSHEQRERMEVLLNGLMATVWGQIQRAFPEGIDWAAVSAMDDDDEDVE